MRQFFVWNPAEYSLEIEAMDEEHQVLIAKMNHLAARNDAGASKAELSTALRDLGRYTVRHFDDEEAYLASIHYPKLDTHRAIHRDLLRSLHEHIAAFESGDGKVSAKFLGFLKLWLGAHIKGIDMQYARFSRAREPALT